MQFKLQPQSGFVELDKLILKFEWKKRAKNSLDSCKREQVGEGHHQLLRPTVKS